MACGAGFAAGFGSARAMAAVAGEVGAGGSGSPWVSGGAAVWAGSVVVEVITASSVCCAAVIFVDGMLLVLSEWAWLWFAGALSL